MRAAVYYGPQDIRIEAMPRPEPLPHEILLEITAAGICGTDAHEFETGPHQFAIGGVHPRSGHQGPMIMGHEFAGRVVQMGSGVDNFSVGELVVCGAGVSCGRCHQCARGRSNLCVDYWTYGLQANGGLAEFIAVPAEICFSADDYGLSDHLAGICQPLAIAVHASRRGRVNSDDEVVILGAGGIGSFLVAAVSSITSEVTVVDLSQERLEVARAVGAKNTHQVSSEADISRLKAEWGIHPTVVFEVSGTEAGLASVGEWLEPGGRLVLVGLQDGIANLDYRATSLVEHELIGTNAHVARTDFPRALEILAGGGIDWGVISPEVIPLEKVVTDGIEPLAKRVSKRIKTLIDPRVSETQVSHMSLLHAKQ